LALFVQIAPLKTIPTEKPLPCALYDDGPGGGGEADGSR
jgi:hypothetical protein